MRRQIAAFKTAWSAAASTPAEARMIELAKQGDGAAIVELYRNHFEFIYHYIRARVRDAGVAEDLTAQVFLNALEGLPDYQVTDRPFLAWLYRIAYARTVDYFRQEGRRQEVALSDTVAASDPLPSDGLEAEAEWETAVGLIAQLTAEQQDVLMLRFLGDMSLLEVAETLGKSLGAVKALQHRALAGISRLLEEEEARVGGRTDSRRPQARSSTTSPS